MNPTLTIVFLEDSFFCSIFPNESAWEELCPNKDSRNYLYFYLSDGRIRNDEFAKERFEQRQVQAYGDFYELILHTDRTFERFGVPQEPVQLLGDALEGLKNTYFERMENFLRRLESNTRIPVNLCFVPGISTQAADKITLYLRDEGFDISARCDYFEAIIAILQKRGQIQDKIALAVIEAHFGDLYFNYVEYAGSIKVKEAEVLVGKGVDHRIGNLATLLVEKAARQCVAGILNDKSLMALEIKRHHRQAADEIHRFEYKELTTRVELSDFNTARVVIDQADLDRMSSETFQFIKFKFEAFISKYSNLARTERILLRGPIFDSDDLVRFFETSFGASKIIKPMENFLELLSRGVFATAAQMSASTSSPQVKQVTIEIRVTETPVISPSLPPLPERRHLPVEDVRKPPLPEFRKPPVIEAKRPLLPEVTRPPLPGDVRKPAASEPRQRAPEIARPALPPVSRPALPEVKRPAVPEVKRPPIPETPKQSPQTAAKKKTNPGGGEAAPDGAPAGDKRNGESVN